MTDLTDVPTENLRRALDTARYYEDTEASVLHEGGGVTKHSLATIEAEVVARGRCD